MGRLDDLLAAGKSSPPSQPPEDAGGPVPSRPPWRERDSGAPRDSSGAGVRKLDLTGKERQLRSALGAMKRIAEAFARGARRTMPFLTRYRATIVPGTVEMIPAREVRPAPGLTFAIPLATADGLAWATVRVNSDAIAFILEGAMGGKSAFWDVPLAEELTTPQRALVTRIVRSLAVDMSTAFEQEVGLRLIVPDHLPDTISERKRDVVRVVCTVEGLPVPASVTLDASAEALEVAERQHQETQPLIGDPRLVEGLSEVDVQTVAELGRVRIGLRQLLALKAGDVLRLPTATDDAVTVRIAGVEKFKGVPIISRGQLAVEIRSRSED